MLFYQPLFLLLVLPFCYTVYLLINRHKLVRKVAIVVFSVGFYTWIEPGIVPIVIASSILDYLASRYIERGGESTRVVALVLGIAQSLAILIFFKYTVFLIKNVDLLLGHFGFHAAPLPAIALPVGISFIIFEKISYLVDVYRDVARPAASLLDYLLYVFLFPKLLAGPIIKYHEIDRQIRDLDRVALTDAVAGFERFMRGVVKKLLVADVLGQAADLIFAQPSASIGFRSAWAGTALFTLQIYFDFSSYSDMAIGLARMLGFRLNENFRMPYISRSITEFWRRWHISLSTYIRDYVYIPLGGSRKGTARTYMNLWIAFTLSGIWHGANWTFIVWGAYNGFFLMIERAFLHKLIDRMPAFVANLQALAIVMVGWIVFRATTLDQAGTFLSAMVDVDSISNFPQFDRAVWPTAIIAGALSLGCRFVPCEVFSRRVETNPALGFVMRMILVLLFVLACARSLAATFRPFLYFRF